MICKGREEAMMELFNMKTMVMGKVVWKLLRRRSSRKVVKSLLKRSRRFARRLR